ncbi:PREDICTED: protein regulator of cytokinesis 1-like [Polistes canadensis]|uniref:protein regulator of cytokinesis 1-like n=1 Tax=Polistes canadensis TaxID=91411 RepID=UPI000718E199|nr:PREDICTED: protein regulator of cytokinesis 1-like [Polistes canadensis]
MADADEWDSIEQKTSTMVHNAITQLHFIWAEVGYDKETQLVYTDAALDHVQELLTDMVSEFEDKKRLLLEETEQLMQNTSILCKELKETIDTSGYEKLPLFKLQQVLQHDMEKLLRIKEQRKTYLNELLMKEHEICKRLGVQPIGIESKLPTEEELDNFKLYIYKQEAEKISRRALSENKKRRSDLGKTRSPSQNAGTVDMTYGQFQAHLKEREELRSSLLPDQSLSAKSILKTPKRTHVKPLRRKLYNKNASSNTTLKLLQSTQNSPRSLKIDHTPKLTTAPNVLPIIF